MSQLGFIFDLNKCVGCQACQIACSIENDLAYCFSWREINTYNPEQLDSLPHYHLSMACNHCSEPVCLYQCPAKAISKNPDNGIVIIDKNKCIGCKYCNWVCPYDAPAYHQGKNLMTKCTLCSHRIDENLQPACVSICPTGALNIASQAYFTQPDYIAGFPKSDVQPNIQIIPLNSHIKIPEQYIIPYSEDILRNYSKSNPKPENKISLKSEWNLAIFTFLISILGGWLSTSVFGNNSINFFQFILTGLIGMGLSTFHLGKKFYAFRAFLNWKTSWLSREVLFFTFFMIASVLYLLVPDIKWMGYIAIFLGITCAVSVDNVYFIIAGTEKRFFNSAQVWITMLFFIVLFNRFLPGIIIFVLLKLILYLKRKTKNNINDFPTVFRIACLFAGTILFVFNFPVISIDRKSVV